jgi:hypothetical protein
MSRMSGGLPGAARPGAGEPGHETRAPWSFIAIRIVMHSRSDRCHD